MAPAGGLNPSAADIQTAALADAAPRLMVSSASAWLDDAGVGNVVDATSRTLRLDKVARLMDRARISALPDGS